MRNTPKKTRSKSVNNWDRALEQLLSSTSYKQADPKWSDRNLCLMMETKSFMDAVNDDPNAKGSHTRVVDDPTRTREKHIRNMISRPLSPRKPIVIPCSGVRTWQKDKQQLENIIRMRNHKVITPIAMLHNTSTIKESQNVTRPSTVQKMRVNTASRRKPTFYWGA